MFNESAAFDLVSQLSALIQQSRTILPKLTAATVRQFEARVILSYLKKAEEDCELHDLTEEVEPVVSFKTWKRVQAKRQSSPSYRSSESGALFQGLLYCSPCHRLLCTHGSCKGKTKGKIKYACESTYGTRVKKERGAEHSAGATGRKYYCGKQLWEHHLEGPIVAALTAEAEGLELRVTVEDDLEVARRRMAAAQRRLDTALHRAMTLEDITDEEANAGINGAKLQLAAYQERERQIEDEAELVGQLKKLVKSSTTIEALYRDKLGKAQRQRFLHQFITRIDVGASFLTVHWSFKEGKGTKISRSLVAPRRGEATKDEYSIAAGGVNEEAGSMHPDENSHNISRGLMKATVPAIGKKCIDNAKSKAHRRSDNEDKRVVEIGANRQSCEPSTILLFKLVLEVVKNHTSYLQNTDDLHLERSSPLKGGQVVADRHQ